MTADCRLFEPAGDATEIVADARAFAFAAPSVTAPTATETVAVPPDTELAVNVAVYDEPLPAKPVSVPRPTVTSEAVKSATDSLTVNVTVVVPPDDRLVLVGVMVMTGGLPSITIEFVDADETLPAASTA